MSVLGSAMGIMAGAGGIAKATSGIAKSVESDSKLKKEIKTEEKSNKILKAHAEVMNEAENKAGEKLQGTDEAKSALAKSNAKLAALKGDKYMSYDMEMFAMANAMSQAQVEAKSAQRRIYTKGGRR